MRDKVRYIHRLPILVWTDDAEDHIARHAVTPEEVQAVVHVGPRWVTGGRAGTTLVYGKSEAGRPLLVVLASARGGGAHIVTARDLTGAEKRTLRRKGRWA